VPGLRKCADFAAVVVKMLVSQQHKAIDVVGSVE